MLEAYQHTRLEVRAVRAPKGVNHTDWSTSMEFGMDADGIKLNPFLRAPKPLVICNDIPVSSVYATGQY